MIFFAMMIINFCFSPAPLCCGVAKIHVVETELLQSCFFVASVAILVLSVSWCVIAACPTRIRISMNLSTMCPMRGSWRRLKSRYWFVVVFLTAFCYQLTRCDVKGQHVYTGFAQVFDRKFVECNFLSLESFCKEMWFSEGIS